MSDPRSSWVVERERAVSPPQFLHILHIVVVLCSFPPEYVVLLAMAVET